MTGQETVVRFRDMFSVCHFNYKLIGVPPLFPDFRPSRLWAIFFWLSFVNLVITHLVEVIFLVRAFGNFGNFINLIALVPCVCYVTLAINAMVVVMFKRDRIVKVIAVLESQFPTTLEEQRSERILEKKRNFDRPLFYYFVVFVVLITTFNFVPFGVTLVDYLTLGVWEKALPYFAWYPFDAYDDRFFVYMYLHQTWAGFTTAFGMLADVFMMSASVLQFCIQFQLISTSIREYRPSTGTDKDFLRQLIQQHNHILSNAQEFADIISATLFLHQTCSSIVICCVGFQVVFGEDMTIIIKFLQFLVCSLMQTMVLSYFGNEIMEYVRDGQWD